MTSADTSRLERLRGRIELSETTATAAIAALIGVVIHEIGHYIHRVYIKGEAEQAWNEPWKDLKTLARPGETPEPNRDQILDPLGIPTEYGKVDRYEDFAETFMLFMIQPERLSPTATYRMQRALSLSGLYGKPVMRLVARYLALP